MTVIKSVITAGLLIATSTEAFGSDYRHVGTPYYAHPQKKLEKVYTLNSAYLFTEALKRISMAYAVADRSQRPELHQVLVSSPMIQKIFKLDPSLDRETQIKIIALQHAWYMNFPSPIWQDVWGPNEPPYMGELVHEALRLLYTFPGVNKETRIQEYLGFTLDELKRNHPDPQLNQMWTAAKDFCNGKVSPEIKSASELSGFGWASGFGAQLYSFMPAMLRESIENQVLGKDKTCNTVVSDLFQIVQPHRLPVDFKRGAKGQIEGGSVLVAQEYFPEGVPVGASPLFQALDLLSNVQELDPALDDWEAVRQVLGGGFSNRDLIFAFASATHNHSLELYLQKGILALEKDSATASLLSWRTIEKLNHLYRLLDQHYQARKAMGFGDLRTVAERPYHFWGGALVSCELVYRGYDMELAQKMSGMVGGMYEYMTRKSASETVDEVRDSQDSVLHVEGARFGAKACVVHSNN